LTARVEKEHAEWLAEIGTALDEGRVVRALRLSTRPPKAGARFPAALATRLAESAGASLHAQATPDRWIAVLEAIAFSPVRSSVLAASVPSPVPDELATTITRSAGALPQIAAQFGIEPPAVTGPPKPRRPAPPKRPAKKPAAPATATAATFATEAEPAMEPQPAPETPSAPEASARAGEDVTSVTTEPTPAPETVVESPVEPALAPAPVPQPEPAASAESALAPEPEVAAPAASEPPTLDVAGDDAPEGEPETATVEPQPAAAAPETPAQSEPVALDPDVNAGGDVVAHMPRATEATATPEQPE
jgi:hypothetical protein